jgi:hypothetical protein
MLDEMSKKQQDLASQLNVFVAQYDLDMRGDCKLDNGNLGVIGEIRDLKEHLARFPSITWLLANRPIKTAAIILTVYLFLMLLWTVGVFEATPALAGLSLHLPTPTLIPTLIMSP